MKEAYTTTSNVQSMNLPDLEELFALLDTLKTFLFMVSENLKSKIESIESNTLMTDTLFGMPIIFDKNLPNNNFMIFEEVKGFRPRSSDDLMKYFNLLGRYWKVYEKDSKDER